MGIKLTRSIYLIYFISNDHICFLFRFLNIACAVKVRTRNVTLARSSRDGVLHSGILLGYERNVGLFLSTVETKN